MRGETIYIDASIFDSITSEKESISKASIELLQLCSSNDDFTCLTSPFTLFEVLNRSSNQSINGLIKLLHEFNVKLIKFNKPKEIEYLVKLYDQKDILPTELKFEYYHLATAAYLNLSYFCTWNSKSLVTYAAERKLLIAHRFNGYRPSTKLITPEYFSKVDREESTYDLVEFNLDSKLFSINSINKKNFGDRINYVEKNIRSVLTSSIQRVNLPNPSKLPSRQNTIELTDVALKCEVKSYADKIKNNEIPLLDLNHNITAFSMVYNLFKLTVTEGQNELKNRQLKLIRNLPIYGSKTKSENHNRTNNIEFINWLIPNIRPFIDDTNKEYQVIEKVTKYNYREIDTKLFYSLSTESIKTAKSKALELAQLITQNAWQYYQGFHFTNNWCAFSEGFEHGRSTHIIVEKEGNEIWIVFMNAIIP